MTDENVYQAPNSNVVPEGNAGYQYVGFWERVVASIIDSLLLVVVTMPILIGIYGTDYLTSTAYVKGTLDVLINYLFPAIAIILFWIYKSATPGKMLLKMKVVSLGDDEKLTKGQAVIRYLGYFVSMIVLFIGFIWVAFDKKKQGWHDKMANTAVVRAK